MDTAAGPTIQYKIIDIGGGEVHQWFNESLRELFYEHRNRRVPYVSSSFTSSDVGLEVWSEVTCLPDYYQTREEITLLQEWGAQVAGHIPQGASILDLGSGDVKKIAPLLNHLEALARPITYYSIDLSRSSIVRGLERLAPRYKHITLVGLWGTFSDARAYLGSISGPRFLAGLGSMIGNDAFNDAVRDLSSWAALMRPEDRFLLGIDGTGDKQKIWSSYHDAGGVFEKLLRIGMHKTNNVLGHDWFRDEDWVLDGEFRTDPLVHCFFFTAIRHVSCPGARISFSKGDRVECYESHKYRPEEMKEIFRASGLHDVAWWKSPDGDICKRINVPFTPRKLINPANRYLDEYLLSKASHGLLN